MISVIFSGVEVRLNGLVVPWIFYNARLVNWNSIDQLSVSRDLSRLPKPSVEDQSGPAITSFSNLG